MWKRLAPDLSGLPKGYWTVWVGMLVNRLGNFVIPFLSLYLTEQRHFTLAETGAMVSLYGAGALIAGPVGGALADRIGRRATMVLGLCVSAAAMANLGIARHPTHVAVATFLLGALADMYRPAVSAFIADIVPPADRPRAYSLLYWAANLAFSVCPVLAGFLASQGFTLLFIGDALTTLIFGFIVWMRVPETRPPRTDTGSRHAGSGFLTPFKDPVFLVLVGLVFMVTLVFQQWLVTLPVAMHASGISPGAYGLIISINGVLIVALQPAGGRLASRFLKTRVLAVGALFVGAGFGATAFATGPAGYAASIAIWTLGEIALASSAPAVVADLATPETRGIYQGAYQMVWGGASLVGPTAGAAIMERYGAGSLWAACAVLPVVAAIGHLLAEGPRERRLAAAHGLPFGLPQPNSGTRQV